MQPGKYHIIVDICVYLSINSHRKYSEDNLSHMWKYHIVISPLRVLLMMAVIIVKVFSVCRRMLSVWVAKGQAMMGSLYLNYVSHDTVIQFCIFSDPVDKMCQSWVLSIFLDPFIIVYDRLRNVSSILRSREINGATGQRGSKEFLDWRIGHCMVTKNGVHQIDIFI